MDPISAKLNVHSASYISSAKAHKQKGKIDDATPVEKFVPSPKIEKIAKPTISNKPHIPTDVALQTAGKISPATSSAISSAGGPLFKSIVGSIAKWLISDKEEIAIGEAMAKQIESKMPISSDPVLNERVNRIGKAIAKHSSRPNLPYTFKVIDDDTVNAFAGPGGKIYVHRGLLERFPKDSHLAFVLGHEMGHVEHRDSIDRIGIQFAMAIAMAVLGKTQGKLDDILGLVIGKLYDSQISQRAEYAADRRGVEHMAMLGYDPKEAAEALNKLAELEKREPTLVERLFASHPPTKERAKRALEYAKYLEKHPIK